MRTYPSDDYDWEDVKRANADQWQLDLLKLNPSYVHWGPYEDYMCSGKKKYSFTKNLYTGEIDTVLRSAEEIANDYGNGWREPLFCESWKEFNVQLDDLNEVVNFYFEVSRASVACEDCGQTGYNPATRQIADDWYDFAKTGRRWDSKITQDEVQALVDSRRLKDFTHTFVPGEGWKEKDPPYVPTAEEVNAWNKGPGVGHDAINQSICVRTRAERLGVYGQCEQCEGHGYVHTEPNAKVNLVLWLIHPRKGAGRGVEIKDIQRAELPEVFRFLKEAADRNAERFSRVAELA